MVDNGLRADDRGAGSIMIVAIMAAVLALVSLSIPLYTVLSAKQRIAGAADASALAAADVAVGRAAGVPCTVAAAVARANRVKLLACEADGLILTVRVGARVAGLEVTVTATAGPPR